MEPYHLEEDEKSPYYFISIKDDGAGLTYVNEF